jgi:hypothetical protein
MADEDVARDTLPFPLWVLFGLGALSCATWVGATLLDLWAPTSRLAPTWVWRGAHVALVLTVPALILLFVRSSRMPPRRHPRALLFTEAFVALIVALPALLPITTQADLASLPLRVPTLSLGTALAAIDPLVIERWRLNGSPDSSTALAIGAGFGVAAFAASAAVLVTYKPQCAGHGLGCAAVAAVLNMYMCGATLLLPILSLFGAWLGYAIGAWVARAAYW